MNSNTVLELRILAALNPVGTNGHTDGTRLAEHLNIAPSELQLTVNRLLAKKPQVIRFQRPCWLQITFEGKVRLAGLCEQLLELVKPEDL